MAFEIFRLFRETNVCDTGIFVMGGHKEGIVSFGKIWMRQGGILNISTRFLTGICSRDYLHGYIFLSSYSIGVSIILNNT